MSAPADEAEAQVKGLAFRSVLAWYEAHFGHEELVRRARESHPWLAETLSFDDEALGVIVNKWYPAAVTSALADAVTLGVSDEDSELMSSGAAVWILRDTVRGLYKLLFDWIATPSRFVKYRARVWGSYYDHGSFELEVHGERQLEIRIREWRAYHPFVFALTRKVIFGMFEEMGCEVEERGPHLEEGAAGVNAFHVVWSHGGALREEGLGLPPT